MSLESGLRTAYLSCIAFLHIYGLSGVGFSGPSSTSNSHYRGDCGGASEHLKFAQLTLER